MTEAKEPGEFEVTLTQEEAMRFGTKSTTPVPEPVNTKAGYEIQLADDNWAVVLKAPEHRFQRFLQLLVGIQWRPRV